MQAVPHLSGICAVGLAGPEVGNPPSNFKEVFGSARLLRLHKVAHAGAGLIGLGIPGNSYT
jgi:adenosine deaminase